MTFLKKIRVSSGYGELKQQAIAGKLGGKAKSKAKRLAAIRNGANGGRPRKIVQDSSANGLQV